MKTDSGEYVQISRMGNPLINEVIVPYGFKDFWNSQVPRNDAQFAGPALAPELAKLINLLYPATADVDETNRLDLKAVLLTGLPGFTFTSNRVQDYLRLNTGIPPCTADARDDDAGSCRALGAFLDGADLAAFPNGRRLEDDVTDIELRAVGQGYGTALAAMFGVPNKAPNNTLTDGVQKNDVPFLNVFPYTALPHSGYESIPHGAKAPV